MRLGSLLISVLAFLAPLGLSGALEAQSLSSFENDQGSLALAGNRGLMNIARSVAGKITEINPRITFRISDSGNQDALEQLRAGLIQIAGLSRPLKDAEISQDSLIVLPIAQEGAVVAVNLENPVSRISQSQLQGVLSGRITNWLELGGRSRPINLYVPPAGSATRQIIEEAALEETPIAPSAKVMGSSPAVKNALGEDPDGLGFINITNLDILVKGLIYEGVSPNLDNSAYQLNRSLYFIIKGQAQGLAKNFIDFIKSPEGGALVREAGYGPGGR